MSIVADAADSADGVMQWVLAYGRYPDCARSEPPLAAEDNFNPKCAEEGLCPAQPASQCAGALWPASPAGAGLQEVGCASRPLCSVGHDLAHTGRHRIGVDDIFDRGAPVARVRRFQGACGLKCGLTGCDPECEVGHARQLLEAHP